MKDIVAVIPVKKNSSRLPSKNILPFAGTNLLEHKIEQLKSVTEIDEIVVSSDSEEMLEIALSKGVSIDSRPIDHANESRPFSDFLLYLTDILDHDHLMWACCTSPLIGPKRYKEAINLYFNLLGSGFDSLITVHEFKHFMLDDEGPMNFKRGPSHVNSQELPGYDVFTNGIILSPMQSVKDWKYHFGPKVYRMNVSQAESIDIDTKFDYMCALAGYEELKDML